MSHHLLRKSSVITAQLKQNLPDFKVGSVVAVHYKIVETNAGKTKERTQVFRGMVTDRHEGNSVDATFTVSKNSVGAVKIERTFPLHSPMIEKIVVETLQRSRRSSLKNLFFDRKDLIKELRAKGVKLKVAKEEPVKKTETETKAKKEDVKAKAEQVTETNQKPKPKKEVEPTKTSKSVKPEPKK